MEVIAYMSLDGVPPEKIVVLPNLETFSLLVSDREAGYKVATHISCPSARYTSLTYKKGADVVTPDNIFPTVGSLIAIVYQYSRGPVEKAILEMSAIPSITCKLTFLSPGPNVIELCFRVSEEDADPEDLFALLPGDMLNQVFTQATRTIRNHPQLENLKCLHFLHSPFSYTDIPHLASEVGQLFESLGPLHELVISNCDLRPYFCSSFDFRPDSIVFPLIKEFTISHPISPFSPQCTTAILEFAKSQYALGIPLERVIVRRESMPAGMEEGLKPWVAV